VTGAYSLWQDVASYFGSGEGPATDADLTLVNEGAAEGEVASQTASRLSPEEQATMSRLMDETGLEIKEGSHVGEEYVDQFGRTYDAMGTPSASQYWNQSEFFDSIDRHPLKSNDFTVIDLTSFTTEQISAVQNYISGLAPELQSKIIRIGF
jgi:hypothetical protein